MQLLTKALRARLPRLYATEDDADPLVLAKFFAPFFHWTWYAIEFDGDDTFFGLVAGDEVELGYFSLSELLSVEGPFGLGIERDVCFVPRPLSEVRALHE